MTIFSTARAFPLPEFDADLFAFFAGTSGAPADDVCWSGVRLRATGATKETYGVRSHGADGRVAGQVICFCFDNIEAFLTVFSIGIGVVV